ncbi:PLASMODESMATA CALLOSE-BINDING PROTEIN 4-like isoform X2 [Humulus lupulus]|uniref:PLASMODESMATA CALLOSE-BINDING PROTEIN 4-like isoform X2 n=1 Tax=Humulus lupulus TaxID=3486 RepID=UPI002B417B90|nr:PLASMODESMATA CALLOSE-BINDING PROTEIN 4-like isoform X2 [Humulus lupulus]
MAALVYMLVFLTLTGYSSATYCVCKDGVGDQSLQKALDYACGAGADCTPILQNGACYQPNTVKDHCSYAVNSYFQKKGQAVGSCDFSGAATQASTAPATQNSNCVYPSSASTTPTTGTPTTGTPTTGTTTPSTTPTTGTTTPSTTPTTGTTTGTGFTPTFGGTGISPGGSTTFDGSGVGSAFSTGIAHMFIISSSVVTLLWLLVQN